MPDYHFNGHSLSLEYPAVMGILTSLLIHSATGETIWIPIWREKALQMVDEGAQIIDLGGESTRPGSDPVSEKEEIRRVIPFLEKLPLDQFLISIDTTKAEVARLALELGAHIINDVSGGNEELLKLAQKHEAGYVLMHAKGNPKNMQDKPSYLSPVSEIRSFFDRKKELLQSLNLPRVWIDPGIGFGKTLSHNLELMRNLDSFTDEAWGVLLGSSRKSWIDHLCGAPDPAKEWGLDRFALDAVSKGAEIIRVHDVLETVQALQVAKELATNP